MEKLIHKPDGALVVDQDQDIYTTPGNRFILKTAAALGYSIGYVYGVDKHAAKKTKNRGDDLAIVVCGDGSERLFLKKDLEQVSSVNYIGKTLRVK